MLDNKFWKKYFKVYDVLNLCIPYQNLLEELTIALNVKPNEKILDAGGGTGNLTVKLLKKGADITLLDFSKEALVICKKKEARTKTIQGDLTKTLPFANNYFDKIVSNNVIYTINPNKRLKLVKEIYRILKPEGTFVISNIKEGFKPTEIYKIHIKKSMRQNGLLKTFFNILKMLYPTIKIFYYNNLIKKENTSGNYSFLTLETQEELLKEVSFKIISKTKTVYGNQGLLTIAQK